jgi:hypothetical protein
MTEPKPKWDVGEQPWKVIPFVDDTELEAKLNALEADGYCPVAFFRNEAGDGGRESTTIVATLFDGNEQSCDNSKHGFSFNYGGN